MSAGDWSVILAVFDSTVPPLPDRPDEAAVEKWLRRVRVRHLD
jgi:hypothetical protein